MLETVRNEELCVAMARREREARAFGAVEHMMPSRQGDKNNRALSAMGHELL